MQHEWRVETLLSYTTNAEKAILLNRYETDGWEVFSIAEPSGRVYLRRPKKDAPLAEMTIEEILAREG